MGKEDYVVYEKASRNEDKLFLETAREAISGINEQENWKKLKDSKKHAGGKMVTYDSRMMPLILLCSRWSITERNTGRWSRT